MIPSTSDVAAKVWSSYLFFRKRANFRPPNIDNTNSDTFTKQRDGQHCSSSGFLLKFFRIWEVLFESSSRPLPVKFCAVIASSPTSLQPVLRANAFAKNVQNWNLKCSESKK